MRLPGDQTPCGFRTRCDKHGLRWHAQRAAAATPLPPHSTWPVRIVMVQLGPSAKPLWSRIRCSVAMAPIRKHTTYRRSGRLRPVGTGWDCRRWCLPAELFRAGRIRTLSRRARPRAATSGRLAAIRLACGFPDGESVLAKRDRAPAVSQSGAVSKCAPPRFQSLRIRRERVDFDVAERH